MKRATVVEITTLIFISLFLYTGISKIMDYAVFKEQIATSPILSSVANAIAIIVPTVEFFAALLLAIPAWRLYGLYLTLGLMASFTIYIIGIISFNDQLPCSCGGIISELSWSQHIIVNSILIVLAILGIYLQRKVKKDRQAFYSLATS